MDNADDIVEQARRLPDTERDAFLDGACADGAEREHVEALLDELSRADALFETASMLRRPVLQGTEQASKLRSELKAAGQH